ncbi:MAG: hypothetical protein OEY29_10930 [Gammaproteobacteria bacterium]|nr:hypothetical protein [Gammaproteobacteria bacterium]
MLNLNTPRLILSPQQNEFSLSNIKLFISKLSELDFIGSELGPSADYQCFETGDDFLHQITFLGCSPTLFSADNSDDSKTFISIAQHQQIQFANSSPLPPARCPHCQKTDKNWPLYLQHWSDNNDSFESCPNCHKDFNFTQMKWKKNAGYGQLFIQIHGIQEQLAVPNQIFMDELQSLTHTPWEYFFAI